MLISHYARLLSLLIISAFSFLRFHAILLPLLLFIFHTLADTPLCHYAFIVFIISSLMIIIYSAFPVSFSPPSPLRHLHAAIRRHATPPSRFFTTPATRPPNIRRRRPRPPPNDYHAAL